MSILQLAYLKGGPAEAFRPQVCHGVIDRSIRMPDSQLKNFARCRVSRRVSFLGGNVIFVSAFHQTRLDPRSLTRRSIIVGFRGRDGRARAEARALLVYAGHRPTLCNVDLMSLAGLGRKSGSRHVCLIRLDSKVQCYARGTKVSMLQLALQKVAQPKPEVFQPQVGHGALTYICLYLPSDRTWHQANDPKVDYSGDLGEGQFRHESRLKTCWSSAHFVQCGPDMPNRSWIQICVLARIPCYSLNWTARSSAIQKGEKLSMLHLANPKVAQPKPGAFRPQVCHETLTFRHAAGQSAEKPPREAQRLVVCPCLEEMSPSVK